MKVNYNGNLINSAFILRQEQCYSDNACVTVCFSADLQALKSIISDLETLRCFDEYDDSVKQSFINMLYHVIDKKKIDNSLKICYTITV